MSELSQPFRAFSAEEALKMASVAGSTIHGHLPARLSNLKRRQEMRRANSTSAQLHRPNEPCSPPCASSIGQEPSEGTASPALRVRTRPIKDIEKGLPGTSCTSGSPAYLHYDLDLPPVSREQMVPYAVEQQATPDASPLCSVSPLASQSPSATPQSPLDYDYVATPTAPKGRQVARSVSLGTLMESSARPIAEVETADLAPVERPESELRSCLSYLAALASRHTKVDWEEQFHAITMARQLAVYHPKVLAPQLHVLALALAPCVDSLRSFVAKNAILCFGDILSSLGRAAEHELECIVFALVKKGGDLSNHFLSFEADMALGKIHGNVSDQRAILALVNATSQKSSNARLTATRHLDICASNMGSRLAASGNRYRI
eukprot:scaffold603_cov404-Prasinococcus_capsulatus_cf.AAC.30